MLGKNPDAAQADTPREGAERDTNELIWGLYQCVEHLSRRVTALERMINPAAFLLHTDQQIGAQQQ